MSPGPKLPPGVPDIAPPDTGGGVGTRSSFTGGGIHATLVDSISSISSPSDIPGAAGGVANPYRVAQSLEGTPYSQQLRNDCSGMVSKLANAAVGLPPTASFTTHNEGQWLGSHGFSSGIGGPGDLNIGWNDEHTAATLPCGVNAESGGSAGGSPSVPARPAPTVRSSVSTPISRWGLAAVSGVAWAAAVFPA
jgi:hypothetical protein